MPIEWPIVVLRECTSFQTWGVQVRIKTVGIYVQIQHLASTLYIYSFVASWPRSPLNCHVLSFDDDVSQP